MITLSIFLLFYTFKYNKNISFVLKVVVKVLCPNAMLLAKK
jgi:hypothetical protein